MMARFSLYAMSVTDQEEQFQKINKNSRKISEYFIYLNFGGFLLAILVSFWLKIDLDKFTQLLNSEIHTPSDYGLIVKNIPKEWKPEFLEKQIKRELKVDVEYVTYCYDMQQILAKNQEIVEQKKIKQQIEVIINKKMKVLNITREQYNSIHKEEEEEITDCLNRKQKYEK